MGLFAARQADRIVNAADIHIVLVPSAAGPVAVSQPFPFQGMLSLQLSPTVRINGRPAATVGSGAQNLPPHIPASGAFQNPPANLGKVVMGSPTVRIDGKAGARESDLCETCHDMPPAGPQAPAPMIVLAGPSNVRFG